MLLMRLGLVGLIAVAVALAVIAGPRMMAGVKLAEAQDVMRQIRSGEVATFQGVMHAIDSRRAAMSLDPGPRTRAELGEMLLTLAVLDQPQAVEMRAVLAEEALATTRSALMLSPTQPFAWTRYAQALALTTEASALMPDTDDGADAEATAGDAAEEGASTPIDGPLSMAIVTGPWEANLVPTRVEMGLYFWPRLSEFTRRLVAGQIFIAARQHPDRLASVTRRQNALNEVMTILLPDNALLQDFTRVYYHTQSIEMERLAREQGAE